MLTVASRRARFLVVALAGALASAWNVSGAGSSRVVDQQAVASESIRFWYFSADANFEAYLGAFEIPDELPVRLLEVEICRFLDGQHHLTESKIVGGVPQRDIYCEFRVAGHVTTAHVTSLQQR